jgi:hypothetical protein
LTKKAKDFAMFFPTIAAIFTAVGVIGLIVSSLVQASAAGEFVFNAAAACIIAGPVIFFFYVITGLWLEFASTGHNLASPTISDSGQSSHIPIAQFSAVPLQQWTPERLRRMGQLNPTGHAHV